MAQVPTVTAPSVAPSAAPSPGQNINAPAEAFGANVVGAGLQEIGKAAGQTSDTLTQYANNFQALNNKSAADAAFVTAMQGIDQYAEQYKTNNPGMAAYTNLHSAYTDLEALRNKAGEGLSPMAAVEFQANSRRMMTYTQSALTNYAVGQRKESILTSFKATQNALSSDSVLHPEHFESNMRQFAAAQAAQDQLMGLPSEAGAQNMRIVYGQEVSKIAEAKAGLGDPEGAMAFVEAHKDQMDGTIYANTVRQLHPAVQANQLATIGTAAADAAVGGGVVSGSYLSAVNAREGTGANPRSSAVGTGQFLKGTWLNLMKSDPQFAGAVAGKTDAQILDLRNNPDVANAAIQSYAQSNVNYMRLHGITTPDNAAFVGLAHGFGPQGAVDILKADSNTPLSSILSASVMRANPELNGKTAGRLVGQFKYRFGEQPYATSAARGDTISGQPSSYELQSRIDDARANALQHAQALGGDAQFQQLAMNNAEAEMNRRITAQRGNESLAFQNLTAPLSDPSIQTHDQLFKIVQGGLQLYNGLPFAQRTQVDNSLLHNRNEVTPDREANVQSLIGKYGQRGMNSDFLNTDIATMDLTLSQKNSWLLRQAQAKGTAAKVGNENAVLTAIQASPNWMPITKQLGIESGSERYYQFLGALDQEVERRMGDTQHKLSTQEQAAALNSVMARFSQYHPPTTIGPITLNRGGLSWKGDPRLADSAQRQAAVNWLNYKGIPVTEYNISRQIAAGPNAPVEY